MRDLNKSKSLIMETLKSLPEEFTLSSAKSHLQIALNEINRVEKKRMKRDIQQKTTSDKNITKPAPVPVFENINGAMRAVSYIDKMIAEEKSKMSPKVDDVDDVLQKAKENIDLLKSQDASLLRD